jgi:hypothetical protein
MDRPPGTGNSADGANARHLRQALLQRQPHGEITAQGVADEAVALQTKGLHERNHCVRKVPRRLRPLVLGSAEARHLYGDYSVLLRQQSVAACEVETGCTVDAQDGVARAGLQVADVEAVSVSKRLAKRYVVNRLVHIVPFVKKRLQALNVGQNLVAE